MFKYVAAGVVAIGVALVALWAAPSKSAPSIKVEYFQQDSARVIAKWSKACDNKGCADAYEVAWTYQGSGRLVKRKDAATTADTLKVTRPEFGDSAMVQVTVTAIRRGVTSPSRVASGWVRNPDAPPPPVDSLKVDTGSVARADSMRVQLYTADGRQLPRGEGMVAEGDSILAVSRLWLKPGYTRLPKDTIAWSANNMSATVAMRRPFGTWRDSVWVVALNCGCRESGGPNPPVLNLSTGKYQVADGQGGWRPVTPIAENDSNNDLI